MDAAYADTPITNKSPQQHRQQSTTQRNSDERQTKKNEQRRATHDMTRHHTTNKHKDTDAHVVVYVYVFAHVHVWVYVYVGVNVHVHVHVYVYVGASAHVGVTFLLTSHAKTQSGTRTFHDVCCSKPLTFRNGFMFLLLAAVSSTFAAVKPYLMCERDVAEKSYEKQKKHHETIGSHRLRTAAQRMTARRSVIRPSPSSSLLSSLIPFYPLFHVRKTDQNFFRKNATRKSLLLWSLHRNSGRLLSDPGYALPEFFG